MKNVNPMGGIKAQRLEIDAPGEHTNEIGTYLKIEVISIHVSGWANPEHGVAENDELGQAVAEVRETIAVSKRRVCWAIEQSRFRRRYDPQLLDRD